jgi:hypothetical protein
MVVRVMLFDLLEAVELSGVVPRHVGTILLASLVVAISGDS